MIYRFLIFAGIFFTANLLLVRAQESKPRSHEPMKRSWQLVRTLAHPTPSFTQGLLWHQGALFESVGLYGASEVRKLDGATGAVLIRRANSKHEFGEGLALKDNVLIQLTYKEGYALRWSLTGLNPVHPPWTIAAEGWGLTWMPDRERFARSDGSARIRFHQAQDFKEDGGIEISRAGIPLHNINELEYARGYIYANVWGTHAQAQAIIEIDPFSGKVNAEIDLSALCKRERVNFQRELNGIAYNPSEDVFYVTGKNWENIYVVRW